MRVLLGIITLRLLVEMEAYRNRPSFQLEVGYRRMGDWLGYASRWSFGDATQNEAELLLSFERRAQVPFWEGTYPTLALQDHHHSESSSKSWSLGMAILASATVRALKP